MDLLAQATELGNNLSAVATGLWAIAIASGPTLLLGGVASATVSKIMGVSIRVIEKHYSHILTDDIAHATDVLDTMNL